MHVTADNVNFCDDIEGVYIKHRSPVSKARALPDLNMILFVSYKMAVNSVRRKFLCNNKASFYAIIKVSTLTLTNVKQRGRMY